MAYQNKRGRCKGSYFSHARQRVASEPYRSFGENQIGRLLNRYDIPALYEYPTRVFDRGKERTWHPDFTLPMAGLIIEYAGMPDVQVRYVRSWADIMMTAGIVGIHSCGIWNSNYRNSGRACVAQTKPLE